MINKNQFEEFLKDKSLDEISRERLDKIIDDEMKKPEDEMNPELIEYCLDLLNGSDETAENNCDDKKGSGDKNENTLKFSFRHIAALAAVISIVIVAAVSGSASVSHYKMYDGAIEVDGNSVFLDLSGFDGEAQSTVDTSDDKLLKELADNGFSGLLIPRAFLSDEFKITDDIYYDNAELIKNANVKFEYRGKRGSMFISVSLNDFGNGGGEFLKVSSVVEQVKTDKATVFCFTQFNNDFSTIVYRSGLIEYDIQIDVKLDEAIQIAKTIN